MTDQSFSIATRFIKLHPKRAAHIIEQKPVNLVAEYIAKLDIGLIVNLIENLQPSYAAKLLNQTPPIIASKIMNQLMTHTAAVIIKRLPKNTSKKLIKSLSLKSRTALNLILDYTNDTIGAWMNPNIVIFNQDLLVTEALVQLNNEDKHIYKNECFIVDENKILRGTVSLEQLIHAEKNIPVKTFMQKNPVSISGRQSLQLVKSHPIWDEQDHIAVINRHKHIVGMLSHCDLRQGLKLSHPMSEVKKPSSSDNSLLEVYGKVLVHITNLFLQFNQQRERMINND